MLETGNLSLKDYIIKNQHRFHFAKSLNGTLTYYSPKVGQYCILEGFEDYALVIRAPNSNKDYVIQFSDGTKARKNLCNKDVEGFID